MEGRVGPEHKKKDHALGHGWKRLRHVHGQGFHEPLGPKLGPGEEVTEGNAKKQGQHGRDAGRKETEPQGGQNAGVPERRDDFLVRSHGGDILVEEWKNGHRQQHTGQDVEDDNQVFGS